MSEWWYSASDGRKGPVTFEALRELYLRGAIDGHTLAWRENMATWMPIDDISELAALRRAVPPKLPQSSARPHVSSLPQASAGRRFLARLIDVWLFGLMVGLTAIYCGSKWSVGFAFWLQEPGSNFLFGWLLLPFILLVEAFIFVASGTTPGKALLCINLTKAGGGRPSFSECLQRQLGVYWYGLGTGFPIVNLLTMARQRSLLVAGYPTTYDDGRFEVRTSRLGLLRYAAVVGSVGALLLVNLVLAQIGGEIGGDSRSSGVTSTSDGWTNKATGKTVRLPPGWRHEHTDNSSNEPVEIFHSPWSGLRLTLLVSDMSEQVDLTEYAETWRQNMTSIIDYSRGTTRTGPGGLTVWEAHGHVISDLSRRRSVSIAQSGGLRWHVNVVADQTLAPAATAEALKVRDAVLSSLD